MILFFDTETTGFPHKSKPRDHPDQPHIVELAAELTDDIGNTIGCMSVIIDPGVCNGVRIHEKAAEIHGIDEEKAWRLGVHPLCALEMFLALAQRADLIVAHNIDFDGEIMEIALARHPLDDMPSITPFCTMKAAEPILKLPKTRSFGTGQYKWPNLGECVQHFFGMPHTRAHSALWDMRACKDVYFHLQALERDKQSPEAQVQAQQSVWDKP